MLVHKKRTFLDSVVKKILCCSISYLLWLIKLHAIFVGFSLIWYALFQIGFGFLRFLFVFLNLGIKQMFLFFLSDAGIKREFFEIGFFVFVPISSQFSDRFQCVSLCLFNICFVWVQEASFKIS